LKIKKTKEVIEIQKDNKKKKDVYKNPLSDVYSAGNDKSNLTFTPATGSKMPKHYQIAMKAAKFKGNWVGKYIPKD